jgi:hypothetical protein
VRVQGAQLERHCGGVQVVRGVVDDGEAVDFADFDYRGRGPFIG